MDHYKITTFPFLSFAVPISMTISFGVQKQLKYCTVFGDCCGINIETDKMEKRMNSRLISKCNLHKTHPNIK